LREVLLEDPSSPSLSFFTLVEARRGAGSSPGLRGSSLIVSAARDEEDCLSSAGSESSLFCRDAVDLSSSEEEEEPEDEGDSDRDLEREGIFCPYCI